MSKADKTRFFFFNKKKGVYDLISNCSLKAYLNQTNTVGMKLFLDSKVTKHNEEVHCPTCEIIKSVYNFSHLIFEGNPYDCEKCKASCQVPNFPFKEQRQN